MRGGGGEARGTAEVEDGGRWTVQLIDRTLFAAALTAQLSLRWLVLVGQSGVPEVICAAGDGGFGVIGDDTMPGSSGYE